MYLLRDVDCYEFLKSIDNKRISTTEKLDEAIIFDTKEQAKTLKNYIELENQSLDFEILEIKFEVVE